MRTRLTSCGARLGDVAAYRRGVDETPGNDDLALGCIDEALRACVSRMDERAAGEVHMLDMRRRIAKIESLELAGVAFAQRDELRMHQVSGAARPRCRRPG